MSEIRGNAAYEDIEGQRKYFDVLGYQLHVGNQAPFFILIDDNGKTFDSNNIQGRTLFNLINSVYTSVCDRKTCNLDAAYYANPSADRQICTVSMNLPFVLNHFRRQNNLSSEHILLSDNRTGKFGTDYGALMMPDRILQRAAIVLDEKHKVVYANYFADQGEKPGYPDYTEAIKIWLGN